MRIACLLLLTAFAGCAAPAGPLQVELGATGWSVGKRGSGALNVAVVDARGAAAPERIGENQSDPQQAHPITTSGGDLRANLERALERGLRSAGYEVKLVSLAGGGDAKAVRKALGALKNHGLLLVVSEWTATLKAALAVRYDVALEMIEPGRGELSSGEARGQKGFPARGGDEAAGYTQESLRLAVAHVFESLFSQPAIKVALPGGGG